MINYADLMTKAALLRKDLGEDNYSPIDIFALSQRVDDLTVVYYPMGEKLSGMCIKGQGKSSVIAINSSMTLGRQRYSMAHELYHLKYDENMVAVCSKKIGSGKEIERKADIFASYFLMPDTAIIELAKGLASKHDSKHLTTEDIIYIEQYFSVSHQAAVYRLLRTEYLSNRDADSMLNVSVRKTAEMLGYSSDLYMPSPESKRYITYGNYIAQADKAYSRGLISTGKYEELLLTAFRDDLVYGDDDEGGDVID